LHGANFLKSDFLGQEPEYTETLPRVAAWRTEIPKPPRTNTPLELVTSDTKAEAKRPKKNLLDALAEPEPLYQRIYQPKVKLKADKSASITEMDELLLLKGIPAEAWAYKLGNRSALEWVLDQYKEKKPKDPTIREKFNTYRFADYKEQVVDLLKRVTTVSVGTMEVVRAMEKAER